MCFHAPLLIMSMSVHINGGKQEGKPVKQFVKENVNDKYSLIICSS